MKNTTHLIAVADLAIELKTDTNNKSGPVNLLRFLDKHNISTVFC
jgi:hypothetical protein